MPTSVCGPSGLLQSGVNVSITTTEEIFQESVVATDQTQGELSRIITIGTDVSIANGQPILLYGLKGEVAITTVVTLKDAASATRAVLAASVIGLTETVDFMAAAFPKGMKINIASGGGPVLVMWSYL